MNKLDFLNDDYVPKTEIVDNQYSPEDNEPSLDNEYNFDTEECEILNEISKLKPEYRNTIYLYYYEGYKINEIAKILDLNENTVSSNLTRARKKLKEVLEVGGEVYA